MTNMYSCSIYNYNLIWIYIQSVLKYYKFDLYIYIAIFSHVININIAMHIFLLF